jgi:MFS family permease
VGEALRNRRNAYLAGLGFCLVAVSAGMLTAPGPRDTSQPNTLTLVFLVYALASIGIVYAVLLSPARVLGMADRESPRPTMGRMSWLLSVMGVGAMIGPVVLGVILYQISGELWRLALLAGVGVVGGAIMWWRIGDDLRRLGDHGLAAWDPFGPNMD